MGPRTEDSAGAVGMKAPGMLQQLEVEYWWGNDVMGGEENIDDEARKTGEARE